VADMLFNIGDQFKKKKRETEYSDGHHGQCPMKVLCSKATKGGVSKREKSEILIKRSMRVQNVGGSW